MEKIITHYRLWSVLYHDKIYSNSDLVMDICTELTNNLDSSVDVYYEDELITSLGNGNIYHKVDILYCYEYPKVYNESQAIQGIDDGPEIEPLPTQPDNFPGLWQEVFISLLIEHGLPYTDREKQLNYSLDPLTDKILSASSPKVFYLADIEDALNRLRLPFPSSIFSVKTTNTDDLYNKIQHTYSHGWDYECSLSNIRKMMEILEREHEEQKYTARMVIEEHVVYFYFDGHEGCCPKRTGHLHLKHLFENTHKDLLVLELFAGYIKGDAETLNEDTEGMGGERGIYSVTKESKGYYKKRLNKIKVLLKKANEEKDFNKRKVLEEEQDSINAKLKEDFSMGRPRVETSASLKNISEKITKNINNCLKVFPKNLKPLHDHIVGESLIKNTRYFRYSPPDWVRWHVLDKRGK